MTPSKSLTQSVQIRKHYIALALATLLLTTTLFPSVVIGVNNINVKLCKQVRLSRRS